MAYRNTWSHKKSNHCYYYYYYLIIAITFTCCNALEVKAEVNETGSNEVTSSYVDHNWMDDKPDLSHPHSFKNKPSKFDIDVSGLTYTDNNSSQSPSQNPNSIDTKACKGSATKCLKKDLEDFLDGLKGKSVLDVTDSVQIEKRTNSTAVDPHESLFDKVHRLAKNYVLKIKLNQLRQPRTFFGSLSDGKNPFLTGFGLGFLAFGLKKLLLPLIIGAQVIKSILIALFLPSIIGSIGKMVGKGVSSFAQSSQGVTAQPDENFEFKDNSDFYNDDYLAKQPLGTLPASAMYEEGMMQVQKPDSRYSFIDSRLSPVAMLNDRYYTRHAANGYAKKQDFKVFHEIPSSSLLLTNYDPFYSPLLSRLDAVFSRLGHTTEGCREYAVCAMYRSPARFAPYSNLISAQLSRELNELRRPASDNPETLRFFRYMKAAKDGQDGVKCEDVYVNCEIARDDPSLRQNQAMLATYQDIDKLVHARKL
ncbi:protein Osi24 isoform X2 [Cotesia typhae]|uniref:protein Osi24 isoform X2 n=1 Tax=Cotesia typhae TaxID=2053667 RepID=UPI003D687845